MNIRPIIKAGKHLLNTTTKEQLKKKAKDVAIDSATNHAINKLNYKLNKSINTKINATKDKLESTKSPTKTLYNEILTKNSYHESQTFNKDLARDYMNYTNAYAQSKQNINSYYLNQAQQLYHQEQQNNRFKTNNSYRRWLAGRSASTKPATRSVYEAQDLNNQLV